MVTQQVEARALGARAAGGTRLPLGDTLGAQSLIRLTRLGAKQYEREDLGGVRFVPLIGAQGWPSKPPSSAA